VICDILQSTYSFLTEETLEKHPMHDFRMGSAHDGSPHPVDVHVGMQIATARKAKRLSQSQLGAAIGVTFQQVQKYERGTNRVSASTMFAMMHFLNVPSAYFFEGLPLNYMGGAEGFADPVTPQMRAFLSSKIGLEIVEKLCQTPVPLQRAVAIVVENLKT
jgi:transcriptional regulator with XRE-family HTH domain